ncbi:MAG: lipopolysaccharide biosynthesis protein [Flavobacteriaceae bacterium]|jgi:O-antigen/teichoic acid export membrane protein|nr:lipopolysaccharide biosynthesis protein [Flavobacteriaceae bacterium]
MSVVARQGFKYSIIGYLGFLLGTFSVLVVFTHDLEFYGKLRYVLSTAEMLVPIVVFGLSFSNVKFFHQTFKDKKHHNFLSLSLVFIIVNFLVLVGLYFLINYLFPELKFSEIWKMKRLIFPLILVLALSTVFGKFVSNYKRIVIPSIFDNLFPKIANLGAFCLFFFLHFSEKSAYAFFIAVFFLGLVGISIYTNKLEKIKPDFKLNYFTENNLWKNILNYSFFGFLGNIGQFVALRIDNFMIVEFLNFELNGIYSTLFAVISLISVPAMGLYNISTPIVNKHIAENDFEELDRFHKKTSLTLFFVGLVLLSCIFVGFPYLANFMKNGDLLKQFEPVIWIVGVAMLFDLATGFNGHIISMSKYYRFNIVVMLFLAATTVILNFIFLKYTNLELLGIAIAYAVSLTLFNFAKIIFNYWKFKVFPLSFEMMFASIIATLAITSSITILPEFESNFLNLICKPTVVLVFFLIGNYFLKIFPIEDFLNKNFLKSLFKMKRP